MVVRTINFITYFKTIFKIMQKIKFLLFALVMGSALVFTSCSQEEITVADQTVSDDITLGLVQNTDLPNEFITSLDATGRDHKGGFKSKKHKEIAVDSLSDIIKTYIAANYATATVKSAYVGKNGEFLVIITKADGTEAGLLFSAAGAFLNEVVKTKKDKNLTTVDVTTLSAAIKDYVATNYAGGIITSAATNASGEFYVVVTKADGTTVGLKFTSAGVFVKVLEGKGKHNLTAIDPTTLSVAITTYVTTNYATATISKAYTDPSGNYYVSLTLADGSKVRLQFDSAGVFVKVLKKK